jgi:hypothetical protein
MSLLMVVVVVDGCCRCCACTSRFLPFCPMVGVIESTCRISLLGGQTMIGTIVVPSSRLVCGPGVAKTRRMPIVDVSAVQLGRPCCTTTPPRNSRPVRSKGYLALSTENHHANRHPPLIVSSWFVRRYYASPPFIRNTTLHSNECRRMCWTKTFPWAILIFFSLDCFFHSTTESCRRGKQLPRHVTGARDRPCYRGPVVHTEMEADLVSKDAGRCCEHTIVGSVVHSSMPPSCQRPCRQSVFGVWQPHVVPYRNRQAWQNSTSPDTHTPSIRRRSAFREPWARVGNKPRSTLFKRLTFGTVWATRGDDRFSCRACVDTTRPNTTSNRSTGVR